MQVLLERERKLSWYFGSEMCVCVCVGVSVCLYVCMGVYMGVCRCSYVVCGDGKRLTVLLCGIWQTVFPCRALISLLSG